MRIPPARRSHKRPAPLATFPFGAPYYPEHWDAATRAGDPERMAAAGFNLVRMAEFAWDRMEPAEGQFDFALFDDTIEQMGRHGIRTMLCTPTATPPAWLSHRHPDILRVDALGQPLAHGSRRHACFTNPTFRRYSRAITQAMADHFRGQPLVVAWQTDNEFHCHVAECHCASCVREFQAFLKTRYAGDLDRLNAAWGAAFWSQTYRAFEEINTPRIDRPAPPNPGQLLDYYRFLAHAVAVFQHDQVAILRAANPDWWITHNGLFEHIDYAGDFTQDLDVLGWDTYAMFTIDPRERIAKQACSLDRARAWSGNIIIPEHQSGPGSARTYFHDTPAPGEVRRLTYTALSRGVDGILYFRWRSCRFGAEVYWCGILDHDNVPRRRYREIARIGAELKRVGPAVLGTHVHVEAAIAAGDLAAGEADLALHFGLPAPAEMIGPVHQALYAGGAAVGCVHPADDLDDLKLYVIPHWTVFDPAWVPNLERFVARGGVLVIGARSATRDLHNRVVAETPPGCLRALAGAAVEEYGRRNIPEALPLALRAGDRSAPATLWYETLIPDPDTEIIARWEGLHLDGQPAVTCRAHGRGAVCYVGAYLTDPVVAALLPLWTARAGLAPLLPGAPEGLEVSLRTDGHKRLWFLINREQRPLTIAAPPAGRDLVSDTPVNGPLTLGAWDAAVIVAE